MRRLIVLRLFQAIRVPCLHSLISWHKLHWRKSFVCHFFIFPYHLGPYSQNYLWSSYGRCLSKDYLSSVTLFQVEYFTIFLMRRSIVLRVPCLHSLTGLTYFASKRKACLSFYHFSLSSWSIFSKPLANFLRLLFGQGLLVTTVISPLLVSHVYSRELYFKSHCKSILRSFVNTPMISFEFHYFLSQKVLLSKIHSCVWVGVRVGGIRLVG